MTGEASKASNSEPALKEIDEESIIPVESVNRCKVKKYANDQAKCLFDTHAIEWHDSRRTERAKGSEGRDMEIKGSERSNQKKSLNERQTIPDRQ